MIFLEGILFYFCIDIPTWRQAAHRRLTTEKNNVAMPAALLSHTFSKTTLTHLKTNTVVHNREK
jgi:hypothetical protein